MQKQQSQKAAEEKDRVGRN